MKLNMYYQLCDDWGWFVDIENADNNKNIILQPYKPILKKNNLYLNKLPLIDEEDEYEYYQDNYKDPEEKYYIMFKSSNENGKENNNTMKIDMGYTTLITAILTYIIFAVL